jgi:hypothetical protein
MTITPDASLERAMPAHDHDYEHYPEDDHLSPAEEDFDSSEQHGWDEPLPRRWTIVRLALLLLLLILVAAVIVFVGLPYLDRLLAPPPLPLRPPVNT